tara:strand:+ start:26213 stop:28582 length:2370 start_codon:yes stop_codon:yes gene_type:complete
MQSLQELQDGHKDARLRLSDTVSHYSAQRGAVAQKMINAGRSPADVEQLLDSFESLWVPSFGAGSSRAAPNMASRREYDAALRSAVGAESFDRFTASLRDYRSAQHLTADINERLYKAGGAELFDRSEAEASRLEIMRGDIVKAVREMNPTADIKVFLQGLDGTAPSVDMDPLRGTIAIALDSDGFDPDKAVNVAVFEGLTHVLNQKERAILDEAFSTFDQVSLDNGKTWRKLAPGETIKFPPGGEKDGMAQLFDAEGNRLGVFQHRSTVIESELTGKRAAQAFAKYRTGRDKPGPLVEQALKPFNRFFERVNNLARGRGFQSVEDIYLKVAGGELGTRAEIKARQDGVRLPLPGDNKALYDHSRQSIKKMSNFELAAEIRSQRKEIDKARKDMKSVRRQIFAYSSPAKKLSSAANFLSKGGDDAFKKDLKNINELQRGLAAMMAESRQRSSQQFSETMGIPPEPPAQRYSDRLAAQISQELNSAPGQEFEGKLANYEVRRSEGNYEVRRSEGNYDVGIRSQQSADSVKIGVAATIGGAAALINAVEQIGSGQTTMEANRLAVEATQAGTAGNLDIRKILDSGLVDPALNAAISQKDVQAFVYPLKTGDIIFQTDDGRWLAARSENFLKFVNQVGDQHLQAAADVIRDNVVNLDQAPKRTRDLGMAPASPMANQPGITPTDDMGTPSMAASIGGKAMTVGEGKADKTAFKKDLEGLTNDQLVANLRKTQEKSGLIGNSAPRVELQERRSLKRAETALLEVMNSRGIDTKPFAKQTQTSPQPSHKAGPKR